MKEKDFLLSTWRIRVLSVKICAHSIVHWFVNAQLRIAARFLWVFSLTLPISYSLLFYSSLELTKSKRCTRNNLNTENDKNTSIILYRRCFCKIFLNCLQKVWMIYGFKKRPLTSLWVYSQADIVQLWTALQKFFFTPFRHCLWLAHIATLSLAKTLFMETCIYE